MLGSHDSLSGYPLKNWWAIPFNFMSKCQTKSLQEQLDSGVVYFDLRFRKIGNKLYGAHGISIYNITIEEAFSILNNSKRNIYVRVIVEDGLFKDDLSTEELTYNVFKLKGPNVIIHSIGRKSAWGNLKFYYDLDIIGDNSFGILGLKSKYSEIDSVIFTTLSKVTLYECYSYTFLYPRLISYFINKYLKSKSIDQKLIVFRNFI